MQPKNAFTLLTSSRLSFLCKFSTRLMQRRLNLESWIFSREFSTTCFLSGSPFWLSLSKWVWLSMEVNLLKLILLKQTKIWFAWSLEPWSYLLEFLSNSCHLVCSSASLLTRSQSLNQRVLVSLQHLRNLQPWEEETVIHSRKFECIFKPIN